MLSQANGLGELAHDPDDDWCGVAVGEGGRGKGGEQDQGFKASLSSRDEAVTLCPPSNMIRICMGRVALSSFNRWGSFRSLSRARVVQLDAHATISDHICASIATVADLAGGKRVTQPYVLDSRNVYTAPVSDDDRLSSPATLHLRPGHKPVRPVPSNDLDIPPCWCLRLCITNKQ